MTKHFRGLQLILVCTIVVAVTFVTTLMCAAAPVALDAVVRTTVPALIASPPGFDGKTMTVEGEVIGKPLSGTNGTWVNLGDQGSAVGVYCPTDFTKVISIYGDWRNTGDRIRVTGVFRVAAGAQQGETYLEATSLELLERGQPRSNPVEPSRLVLALVLVVVCTGVVRAAWARHALTLRAARQVDY